MPDHDGDYKVTYSHPETVEALLRGFVHERWVKRLDFSTLQKGSASFVSEKLRARHGDRVWRVRLRAGKGKQGPWLYVYLLVEFQSTPYPFMAVRMLGYVSDLLEDLIRERKLTAGDPLPAVLPLVLYSGKRPWNGPTEIAELFPPLPRDLRRRLPRLSYLLIDESRLTPEELAQPGNLVASIFRVETSTAEELVQRAKELGRLLPRDQPELRRDVTLWIHRTLLRRFPGVTIPEGLKLEDDMSMLDQTLKEWHDQMRREAREEGRQEGRHVGEELGLKKGQELGLKKGQELGRLAGMRHMLLEVLEQRFGPLPSQVRQKVDAISSIAALQRLARRALTAESLTALRLAARR